MIEDIIDLTTQSSKVETSNTEKNKREQIEKTEEIYETDSRNSLEDSLWALNENTCEGSGIYKAKIASVSLPGESKEARIKFVEGTIYRSKHISKVEECFIKGNSWVVISFDCHKGIKILKEKLKEKEIEWYNIIFEDYEVLERKSPKNSKHIKASDKDTKGKANNLRVTRKVVEEEDIKVKRERQAQKELEEVYERRKEKTAQDYKRRTCSEEKQSLRNKYLVGKEEINYIKDTITV